MSRWRNCGCAYCRTRGLMWPVILITIGVLFLIQQFGNWDYGFDRTWPVILIVWGAVKLISDMAPTEGHIDPRTQWQTPPTQQPPAAPPPPSAPPPIR